MCLQNIKVDVAVDPGAAVPEYKTSGSSGMDLVANERVELSAFAPTLVDCGISIAVPAGFEAQVRPRSGLSLNGVTVFNTPGTIDSDYRGKVKIILIYIPKDGNSDVYLINKGDRVAQLVFAPVIRCVFDLKLTLDGTERGEGGFGHTGK